MLLVQEGLTLLVIDVCLVPSIGGPAIIQRRAATVSETGTRRGPAPDTSRGASRYSRTPHRVGPRGGRWRCGGGLLAPHLGGRSRPHRGHALRLVRSPKRNLGPAAQRPAALEISARCLLILGIVWRAKKLEEINKGDK